MRMVALRHSGNWSLKIVDLIGGGTAAACVCGLVWLTILRSDPTSAEIQNLSRAVRTARLQLAALDAEQERQQNLFEDHQARLSTRGRLPDEAPVEDYFRALSRLATEHSLRVLRHSPLGSRSYPGLVEHRHTYEVAGSIPNLMLFLHGVESANYWADIGYLQIDASPSAHTEDLQMRVARLTFSLFSAPPLQDDLGTG